MTDEWRVSVSRPKRSRAKEDSPWTTAMQILQGRIGSDIRISETPSWVFLYATSADAAVQAEQAVRDVLAGHGVTAGVRRDRWNPIQQAWTSHEDLMKA